MDSKNNALKIALAAVVLLAILMISYYWIAWRSRKTEHDLNLQEKAAETQAPEVHEKVDYSGMYTTAEAITTSEYRLGFFTVNRREDAQGYSGTAKVDRIGSTQEPSVYFRCDEVTANEKEIFFKCVDATLGQISFAGEWQAGGAGREASGKLLWSKDGTALADKSTAVSRSGH